MMNAYRLRVVRTRIAQPKDLVNSGHQVSQRYAYLQRYDREHFIRLDLDSHNRVIGEETVAIGTAEGALTSPVEVFRGALLSGAVRIILVHNHPGGDPAPSEEDQQVAEKLQLAGELLGIGVVDFVIIGENGRYWSLPEPPEHRQS